jgi:Fanconi anemia group M protein
MQKILKPKGKILIFIDYREKETLVFEHLKSTDALIKTANLDIGDYVVSQRVAIERKNASDFIKSIIDGRIFQQAKKLKENYEKPIIIVEGMYFNRNISRNALKATIATLILDFGIPIIQTMNEKDTADTIYWLAKREQTEKKASIAIKRKSKKPKEITELQKYVLCSLPYISDVLATRLLKKFGSLKAVFNASQSQLQKVEGIGKKKAKVIFDVITKETLK